jgi:outer membrane receptor protein involved in Fe transport
MIGASFRYNSMMRNIDNAFYQFESLGVVNGVRRSRNPKGDYVIDMRIGYEVHKGHRVNFIVNNLLNRVYALRPLAPEAPRYFALQYQVQF